MPRLLALTQYDMRNVIAQVALGRVNWNQGHIKYTNIPLNLLKACWAECRFFAMSVCRSQVRPSHDFIA